MPDTVRVTCHNPTCENSQLLHPRFAKPTSAWYCSTDCSQAHKEAMQEFAEHEARATLSDARPDLYRLLGHLDQLGDVEIHAINKQDTPGGPTVTVQAGRVSDTVSTDDPSAGLHEALAAATEKVLHHLGENEAIEHYGKGADS